MTYTEWAAAYPAAARALLDVVTPAVETPASYVEARSEAWAQQQVRLKVAGQGAAAWRNNNGATPAKCPDCGTRRQPIRYGLANDSAALNKQVKSSDLILAIPRQITPEMVGQTIAQFGSIECKRPGWRYTGKGEEPGQAAWLSLIARLGGFATFSTGDIEL